MHHKLLIVLLFFLVGFLLLNWNCSSSVVGVNLDVNAPPFERLSEYHFFEGNTADLKPMSDVLPYDLNSPLFSDYAHKSRFVWMPKGKTASYTKEGVLDFPVGAVLIKTFYYNHDENDLSAGRQLLETRLLVHREDGWDGVSYIWNEEQTEATLEVAGDIKEVTFKNKAGEQIEVPYVIPNKNQCKSCHVVEKTMMPIGPKIRNLNKSFAYPSGSKNQLEQWAEVAYLTGYDQTKDHPKVPVWDDPSTGSLHDRAMAYLDINCGHCHHPKGPANTSGLNLIFEEPLGRNLGILKPPVAASTGSGGRDYSLVPGAPDESILLYRMESTNPGAMMPEQGRKLVHKEGVALVREWINEMKH